MSIDDKDHHGQDGTRETLTAGEAQREDALGPGDEQTLPAMAQNNATDDEKIIGIILQTRQDVGSETTERISEVLRQRLDQAGIEATDAQIEGYAGQVADGSTGV